MTPILTVLQWFDLIGTTLLAGGMLYGALVAPPSARGQRVLHWAAGLLAATFLLELGVTTLRLGPFSAASGPALIWDVIWTHWGALWLVRCAGLGALLACPLGSRRGALLAAVWLLARSLQSHAGAHGSLAAVIDWLHLLAAAAWLGGLLQFLLSPEREVAAIALRVRRVATAAVAALVPAGVYGALLHVPDLEALIGSTYGRVLLLKIAAASVLLALGAANHFLHVPALRRRGAGRLQHTVRVEIVVGAVVLLLSALLGVVPMPHPPPG